MRAIFKRLGVQLWKQNLVGLFSEIPEIHNKRISYLKDIESLGKKKANYLHECKQWGVTMSHK